jgi:hypothetical protein
MPTILPVGNTWPYAAISKISSEGRNVWVVYCKKCGRVIGTRRWLNEYPNDINFQGCSADSSLHDLWEKLLSDEDILVIWREVRV